MNSNPHDNPIPDDELLSAYLDGELSADERLRVERLLAELPESRQMLDELRALRSTLEAVPRYRLEDDFAARVLRAAERAILSGEALSSGQAGPSAQTVGDSRAESDAAKANGRSSETGTPISASSRPFAGSSQEAGWSWQRARRPMVWSGLALAAGLLIMLALPDGPRERNVALAPSNAKTDTATRNDFSLRKAAGGVHAEQGVKSAFGDGDMPMPYAADADMDAAQQDNEAAAATSSLGSQPSAPAAEPPSFGLGGGGVPAEEEARGRRMPSRGSESPESPGNAPGGMGGRGARMAGKKQDAPTEPEARRDAPGLSAADAIQLQQEVPTAENTLLIVCDVAFDLVDRPEFQQLLAKHNIILEQVSVEPRKGAKKELEMSRDEEVAEASLEDEANETDGDRELSMFLKRRRSFGASQGGERESALDALDDALQGGETEGLLVEATEAQLEAVVADFEQQAELFLSVEVHPAPDVPEQQALTTFSRRLAAAKPPAGPTADDGSPEAPVPPAPAAATESNVEDGTKSKDRPAAPADVGETAKFAAPLVQGRAKRLETRRLAELKQTLDEDSKKGAKPETAPGAKAGAQSGSQATQNVGKPSAGKPTGAAADDARHLKAKTPSDSDDKYKSNEVSDVAEALNEMGKPGSDRQGGEARTATNGANAPRRALLIFRHVAPDAIDPASPENR